MTPRRVTSKGSPISSSRSPTCCMITSVRPDGLGMRSSSSRTCFIQSTSMSSFVTVTGGLAPTARVGAR
jgi:hypothetical protein